MLENYEVGCADAVVEDGRAARRRLQEERPGVGARRPPPAHLLVRGQPVARSGYSGIDAVITFPWGTPHIHFNVWLHGRPVDPNLLFTVT